MRARLNMLLALVLTLGLAINIARLVLDAAPRVQAEDQSVIRLAREFIESIHCFDDVLLSAVLYHAGGPMILPGALRPEEADEVTPELITRAIAVLRKSFRYIVVDLGVTITDATLALFDLTQHVVLVTAPELSAAKSAADAIEILGQLGTPHDRLTVVLNHRSIKPAVTRAAVERLLKRPVDIEVAFDGSRPEQAAVDGVILSLTNPKSEVAKGSEALAEWLDSKHGGRREERPRDPAPAAQEELVPAWRAD